MKITLLTFCLLLCALCRAEAAAALPQADLYLASNEVSRCYDKAHPEVQEFVLQTARTFGAGGMWLNENAFAALTTEQREARILYLSKLFNEGEYGRHLCAGLAEASALKDARLVGGLLKVAAYHVEDQDYDCRPKWMAIAALARQESAEAVPVLVSLVDHGNQNTHFWARAALARMAKDDFKSDKQAWNKWWVAQGHPAIDAKFLKPYVPPPQPAQAPQPQPKKQALGESNPAVLSSLEASLNEEQRKFLAEATEGIKTKNSVAEIARLEDTLQRWDELATNMFPEKMRAALPILKQRVVERVTELKAEAAK